MQILRKKNEDILKQSICKAIVNPVNCVGVMGKGLAKQFKARYPDNFVFYRGVCRRRELRMGQVLTHRIPNTGVNNIITSSIHLLQPAPYSTLLHFIINFPTKKHWRNRSHLYDIAAGLKALKRDLEINNIESVAIPKLGCGLGGLNWTDVKKLIEDILPGTHNLTVVLFE